MASYGGWGIPQFDDHGQFELEPFVVAVVLPFLRREERC